MHYLMNKDTAVLEIETGKYKVEHTGGRWIHL